MFPKSWGKCMKTYFKNVPNFGNLILEHTFYDYGEPILFVCRGIGDVRYLCSCCKLSEEWILVQASEDDLVKLIDETATIRSIFENCGEIPFMLLWNGAKLSLCFDEVSEELLPDDAFLELSAEETAAYREFLCCQLNKKLKMAQAIQIASRVMDTRMTEIYQKIVQELNYTYHFSESMDVPSNEAYFSRIDSDLVDGHISGADIEENPSILQKKEVVLSVQRKCRDEQVVQAESTSFLTAA